MQALAPGDPRARSLVSLTTSDPTGATRAAGEDAARNHSREAAHEQHRVEQRRRERGATSLAMRFEVAMLPVADVDRAKAFYEGLGWRLDIDFEPTAGVRLVQFTPPGSPASIHFGQGRRRWSRGRWTA